MFGSEATTQVFIKSHLISAIENESEIIGQFEKWENH